MIVKLVDKPKAGTDEKYVGACGGDDELVYPGISSCLTITAVFEDGSRTGVHLVLADGKPDWPVRFKEWIGETRNMEKKVGKLPSKVIIAGSGCFWKELNLFAKIKEQINKEFSNVKVLLYGNVEGDISVYVDGAIISAKRGENFRDKLDSNAKKAIVSLDKLDSNVKKAIDSLEYSNLIIEENKSIGSFEGIEICAEDDIPLAYIAVKVKVKAKDKDNKDVDYDYIMARVGILQENLKTVVSEETKLKILEKVKNVLYKSLDDGHFYGIMRMVPAL